jgi:hypothetical protein
MPVKSAVHKENTKLLHRAVHHKEKMLPILEKIVFIEKYRIKTGSCIVENLPGAPGTPKLKPHK